MGSRGMKLALLQLVILLYGTQLAGANTIFASTGKDVALGFADPTVDTVVVTTDVAWTDVDWSGLRLPVVLQHRNFTVTGIPDPSGLYPTFDSNYVTAKVRLANSTLTFRNLAILHSRKLNQNLAPGSDLLTPCLPGDWGHVVLETSFLVQRLCYPASMHPQASGGAIRPSSIPGSQTYRSFLPQPNCANGTASGGAAASDSVGSTAGSVVPLQLRCWVHMGAYDDMGVFCADLDSNQKQVPTGYTMHIRQVIYVCDDMITDECVRRLGTLGCYNAWGTPAPPPVEGWTPPPDVSSGGGNGSAGGGGGRSRRMLGGALGGALGGLALMAVLAGATVAYCRARERAARACFLSGGLVNADASGEKPLRQSWTEHPMGVLAPSRIDLHAPVNVGSGGNGPDAPDEGPCPALVRLPGAGAACRTGAAPLPRTRDVLCGQPSAALLEAAGGEERGCADRTGDVLRRQSEDEAACATPRLSPTAPVPSSPNQAEVISERLPPREGLLLTDPVPKVRLLPGRVLGRGRFGRVVEGEYRGRVVAVKLLDSILVTPAEQPADKAGQPADNPAACGLIDDAVTGGVASGGAANSNGGSTGGSNHAGSRLSDIGKEAREGGNAVDAGIVAVDTAHAAGAAGSEAAAQAQGGVFLQDPKQLECLAQEVEVLGRCRHPNVVTLLAACLTPPRFCLVMERMDTSLERLLHGGGEREGQGGLQREPDGLLPLETVLGIALDVARGLEYLHPTVVHRDLKPANVLVNRLPSGRLEAKLSDFGLSRIRSTVAETDNPEAGTPAYMAPELFDPHNYTYTHKADVYSFGVMLAEMLSGQRPWEGLPMVSIAYRVAVFQDRPPLHGISQQRMPPKLRRLIESCWESDPERRPAAAEIGKYILLVKQQTLRWRSADATQMVSAPAPNCADGFGCCEAQGDVEAAPMSSAR